MIDGEIVLLIGAMHSISEVRLADDSGDLTSATGTSGVWRRADWGVVRLGMTFRNGGDNAHQRLSALIVAQAIGVATCFFVPEP
jgi:hypothetical protein